MNHIVHIESDLPARYHLVGSAPGTYGRKCGATERLCWWNQSWTQTSCSSTHTRLTALFPGLPGWAGTRKAKPNWILLKQETLSGSGFSWAICKSAPRSRQITMPSPHHSVFLQAGCPSCRPTNSVKALKALKALKLLQYWQRNAASLLPPTADKCENNACTTDIFCTLQWTAGCRHKIVPVHVRSGPAPTEYTVPVPGRLKFSKIHEF